ncbi:2994_t:CDS:1 [Paraglomus occultum]|uniref:2994_t:CDS:1 n=1 Tax=Paraglomus occultum TaxID=144539 RepID=A0A9N9A3J3_9GLOM|nr:2994_t:CDS:1 [Paraglomus occultum]
MSPQQYNNNKDKIRPHQIPAKIDISPMVLEIVPSSVITLRVRSLRPFLIYTFRGNYWALKPHLPLFAHPPNKLVQGSSSPKGQTHRQYPTQWSSRVVEEVNKRKTYGLADYSRSAPLSSLAGSIISS